MVRPVRKSAQADSQACSDRYMYGLLGRERSLNGVKWGEYMNFSPLPPESPLEKCSSRGEAPMFQKMQRDGQVETQSKEHINVRVTEGMPDDPAECSKQNGHQILYLKRKAWLSVWHGTSRKRWESEKVPCVRTGASTHHGSLRVHAKWWDIHRQARKNYWWVMSLQKTKQVENNVITNSRKSKRLY